MRPRVLFVSYTSEWTGPTNSLLLLLERLRDVCEIAVVLPDGGDFRVALERKGIRHFTLPSITKRYLGQLVRLIQQGDYDLVYANTSDRTSRLAFVAARVAGPRYVCHVRALGWDSRWTQSGHLRFADAVIAVSRAAARSVERFVSPCRLHVVHNGIRTGGGASSLERAESSTNLRAEMGWPEDSIVLAGLANVCERKGQIFAVEALAALRFRVPKLRLALIGRLNREPDYASDLQETVRKLELQDRVRFLGFREDGARLLGQADMLIHTALADPHPRAVLEAMVAGIPVVGFDVDGVGESVVHGGTGLLVPAADAAALADAVERLACDQEWRADLGEAGVNRAESEFTDRATAMGVWLVIQNVLGTSHERRNQN